VATQSQEKDLDIPDYGQLVQESKKYRKRAQDSEAQLEKLNKKIEQDRTTQLEEQNQWQQLAEERGRKLKELEPVIDQYKKEELEQRETILARLSEEDREQFGDLPLPKLRILEKKLNNHSNVPSTSVSRARTVNPTNKDWTKMTAEERRSNWGDIVKGYALQK
jgi:TolA-binding protein